MRPCNGAAALDDNPGLVSVWKILVAVGEQPAVADILQTESALTYANRTA
jgi:hypothetical protein